MSVPFGILYNSSGGMNAEFADFAKMGVSWIRTDFAWDLVQPNAGGGYNWANYDSMVSMANSYGIKVLGLLDGLPGWAANSGSMANSANQQAYAQFGAAAAQHFAGQVSSWEVGNEENLAGAWGAQPSAADYTATLKDAYTSIKAVASNDTVMSGGLASVPSTGDGYVGAADFMQQMYADGASGYFDAVAFHPYTWPYLPGTESWNGWQIMTGDIRSDMVAHGDGGKQIWVTEVGAPTGGPNSVSEQTQSDILKQNVNLAQSDPSIGPVIWHSYQDLGGDPGNTEDWYGLVRPDGSQKPAYATFQSLAGNSQAATTPSTPSTPSTGSGAPSGNGATSAASGSADTTIGAGADALVLKVSQDAYLGSAQYTVSVDGTQIGGTLTANASHGSGQDDTVTVNGNWAAGNHSVSVNFLNDAWGGTPGADRNLYLDGATYDGATVPGSTLALGATGAESFSFATTPGSNGTTIGSGSQKLDLQLSEDSYLGDAQFTIQVDGHQIGGTLSTAASHALGQEDMVSVLGDWGSGSHTATINYLNDAYGGSANADRNLYVDAGSYNGANVAGAHLALYAAGQQSFSFS